MTDRFSLPQDVMSRALELAARGIGRVEPNPAVGAVLVDDSLALLGEGCHEQFGGPHAEVNAIAAAGARALGATLYVTLEPCCHHGKTPPCVEAVLRAGIRRVVIATQDPAPHVDGGGVAQLKAAGVEVEVGLLEKQGRRLIAPFEMLTRHGRPYVHAKWAMTLDGKIAARTGASRWISSEASRQYVHTLRGRVDAVLVGSETARIDDPLLTARPPGPRVASRVVVDSRCRLSVDSQLVRTIDQAPVIVVAGSEAERERVERLRAAGVEVLEPTSAQTTKSGRFDTSALLHELGARRMTNVLVEGGGALLGAMFDQQLIDELHVFIAPKLVGGEGAVSPIGGVGLAEIPQAEQLQDVRVEASDGDVLIHGFRRSSSVTK